MQQKLNKVDGIECLYRSEQSGVFYFIVKRDQRQVKRSLKTTDLAEARRKVRIELGTFESHEPLEFVNRPETFRDLLQRYLDVVVPTKDLKPKGSEDIGYRALALRRHSGFTDLPLTKITLDKCRLWFAARRKQVGPTRVNTELYLLKAVFEYAVESNWQRENPAQKLKRLRVVNNEPDPPTKDEFLLLVKTLRAFPRRDAADFIELLAYSGLRLGGAAALTWADVDFETGVWRIAGKGRRVREFDYVPIFAPMRRLLLEVLTSRGGLGKVAPTDRIMRIKQCRDSLIHACKTAGLRRFTHHDMRRFFTTIAMQNNVDVRTIAGWLRHKDNGALLLKSYAAFQMEHSRTLGERMRFDAADELNKPKDPPKTD